MILIHCEEEEKVGAEKFHLISFGIKIKLWVGTKGIPNETQLENKIEISIRIPDIETFLLFALLYDLTQITFLRPSPHDK